MDGTLLQACTTEGRALPQLPFTILFVWVAQTTMGSSSGGDELSASSAFIKEHVSLHGAGLSEKVRAAATRVLGKIEPEDEGDFGLISEEDFALFVRSAVGSVKLLGRHSSSATFVCAWGC
jgi:hypothetical protein